MTIEAWLDEWLIAGDDQRQVIFQRERHRGDESGRALKCTIIEFPRDSTVPLIKRGNGDTAMEAFAEALGR